MTTVVIGIDPSLTSTGVSDGTRHETIKTVAGDPLRARTTAIVQQLAEFIRPHLAPDAEIVLAIEGPLLHGIGPGHLYEAGWLMCRIDMWIAQMVQRGVRVRDLIVPTATLRKYVVGKGNAPTKDLPLKVYRRWGVDIENDRGFDKVVAYCLYRYGQAVVAGEIEHAAAAPRGQGSRSRAAVAKRSVA